MKSILVFLIGMGFISCHQIKDTAIMNKKIVIAHRGASGYLPEHTMEAKAMAHAMNCDFIEQDVVLSKDDVAIVIHDIYLDDVTDVATKFSNRKRADNRYYVVDFTFAELQTLKVFERFNHATGAQLYLNRFPKGAGTFKLHSFEQELQLIQGLNKSTQKNNGYHTKKDNCILQCFDAKELERIRIEFKSELFLVQLIETPQEAKQLKHFATYADGIGPHYKQILEQKVAGKFTFTSLVTDAHALNLKVHPYTLRADVLDEFSSFEEMMETLLISANTDGAFTDFPDLVSHYLNTKK